MLGEEGIIKNWERPLKMLGVKGLKKTHSQ